MVLLHILEENSPARNQHGSQEKGSLVRIDKKRADIILINYQVLSHTQVLNIFEHDVSDADTAQP